MFVCGYLGWGERNQPRSTLLRRHQQAAAAAAAKHLQAELLPNSKVPEEGASREYLFAFPVACIKTQKHSFTSWLLLLRLMLTGGAVFLTSRRLRRTPVWVIVCLLLQSVNC
jgi:hypothetical protein